MNFDAFPARRKASLCSRHMVALIMPVAAAIGLLACRAQATARPKEPGMGQLTSVQLEGPAGVHALRLELACSAQQHAQGLMGRTTLAPADGMLFAFADEAPRTFWMHNTSLCLDLLFFGRNGALTCIIDRAAPNTDTARPCALPSAYVVELPGGTAAKWRIDGRTRLNAPSHARLCPP